MLENIKKRMVEIATAKMPPPKQQLAAKLAKNFFPRWKGQVFKFEFAKANRTFWWRKFVKIFKVGKNTASNIPKKRKSFSISMDYLVKILRNDMILSRQVLKNHRNIELLVKHGIFQKKKSPLRLIDFRNLP